MKKSKKEFGKKIKIKGIVIPMGWDEKGNVTAVNISTHNEDEYSVEMNQMGKELLALIREPVKVTGILKLKKNSQIIDVEKYSVIKI